MSHHPREHIWFLLRELYGEKAGSLTDLRLREIMRRFEEGAPALPAPVGLSERDAILITYADQVTDAGKPPLATLAELCEGYLQGLISTIHLLPFFPSSSDDGFSVVDYRAVDPALGNRDDVARLGQGFGLMFDAVINHASARGAWFQAFLRDEAPWRDFFITVDGEPDLSQVVRPRTTPLLTRFDTTAGPRRVWTTFSADQVDLNYVNPVVLLEMIDVLLGYVRRGAGFLRLDAVAYLWKEIGTSCIHHPQTHRIVQLLRAVLDEVAPGVKLITETNVPHSENMSYFGSGENEAHLVYNFALPPLVLHTFHTGNAGALSSWASGLRVPSRETTFFNFLASHDGIGLSPSRGILTEGEIETLVVKTREHGGLVSYKQNPDGSQSPYELNINYFDALSSPNRDEPLDLEVDRFMAAQSIMLSLRGVPGIYFHSLFGSRGWPEGPQQTGHNRAINRQKLDWPGFRTELADPASRRRKVFNRYARMLRARRDCAAFHPNGEQEILDCGGSIFAVMRRDPATGQRALCLHNVTERAEPLRLDLAQALGHLSQNGRLFDLVTDRPIEVERGTPLRMNPYQTLWLVPEGQRG